MKTTREALIEATARLRFVLSQVPEDEAKELLRAIQIIVKVRNRTDEDIRRNAPADCTGR